MVTQKRPTLMVIFGFMFFLSVQPSLLSSVQHPESIHRRSWVLFPQERLMQRMLLEATLKHSSPITHACSSLEGSSCLYGSRTKPAVARDLLAEEAEESQARAARREVKLIMLRPDAGTDLKSAIKKYMNQLQEQRDKVNSEELGTLKSEGDNSFDVIYEGTSEGLADEGLVQRMVQAGGLPQSAAAALQSQLDAIKDLDLEGQQDELTQAAIAGSDSGSQSTAITASADSQTDRSDGGGTPTQSHTIVDDSPSDLAPEAIEGMSREQLASSYKDLLEAMRVLRHSEPPKEPLPVVGNGVYRLRDNQHQQARDDRHLQLQQQQQQPTVENQVGHGQRQRLEPSLPKQNSQSSFSADRSHSGEASRPKDKMPSRDKIYIDDAGREFLLDTSQQGDGQQEWYDSQTGNTYTAEDIKGSPGRLTRQLANDRAWLDGLNDAEYDTYWDSYNDEVDREAATNLDNERRSGGKLGHNGRGRQRQT